MSRRYKGRLDDDADAFIGYAVDGATRMSALIQGVLAYARVGATPRDAEAVDLGALVSGVVATLRAMIDDKGATVTIGPLPTLEGDGLQLGQLFQNLIGNALKFCTEAPAVSITAEEQRGAWLLRVRDNGVFGV